jgi:ABC-type phosphate transport system substrate-binding protein
MRVLKAVVVAAAAVALIGTGVGPALADPPTGVTPTLCSVVGVGAQSTALVMDAIAAAYDAAHPTAKCKLYSWDGVNPATGQPGGTIITKGSSSTDTTCSIARPDGSSAGVEALAAHITDDGHPCIDYARSETGPTSTSPPGLVWVGFALDAVSWTTTTKAIGEPTSLNATQLHEIYSANTGDCLTWKDVGGTSTAPIVPALPQSSSETRPFFLAAIGVTTPGSCVVNGEINIPGDPLNPVPLAENTAVSVKNSGGDYTTGNAYFFAHNPDAIYPYSVADWIAQQPAPAGGGHATASFGSTGVVQPREIGGISPITAGSPDTISKAFETGAGTESFTHFEYNVVPNAGTVSAPEIPPGPLTTFFGPKGVVCSSTTIIKSYGFALLGSRCGFLVPG